MRRALLLLMLAACGGREPAQYHGELLCECSDAGRTRIGGGGPITCTDVESCGANGCRYFCAWMRVAP